LTLFIS